MQAAEAGRLPPQAAYRLGSELGLIVQSGSEDAHRALLELQVHGQRNGACLSVSVSISAAESVCLRRRAARRLCAVVGRTRRGTQASAA